MLVDICFRQLYAFGSEAGNMGLKKKKELGRSSVCSFLGDSGRRTGDGDLDTRGWE